MELYDVMRTTFAARDFTDDELPDDTLYRILDNARFAPSGGNRQGGRVIVVKNPETKQALGHLCLPALRVYGVQRSSGESPWQSVHSTNVDVETVWNDESIRAVIPMFEDLSQIPTVLVIAVDLEVIASMDKNLDRVGIISGGSIYPMAWNILLGARNEGFGGTLTTLLAANEAKAQELLGLEPNVAVAALLTIGKPKKQLTKLTRKKVEDFTTIDRADGPAFTG
ncbi:MAG: nitroreductase family protein [Actinomycetota bacterium]|jgi:nitroreductase|nr:nitroreductase family protein [Actinomycetota bacterium]|tara:strand:+ start:5213 stop:5887 length:675 start_codon:yes stop_codon:yes gene_type:complete